MLEFLNTQWKNAYIFGMSYVDFWYSDPQIYYDYEIAFKEKINFEQKIVDARNWQLGCYFQMAVGSCLDNKCKYPKKPIFNENNNDNGQQELTEEQQQIERKKCELFFNNFKSFVKIKEKDKK